MLNEDHSCKKCKGEHWVKNEETGDRVECSCLREKRKRHMFEIMGVPPKFRDKNIDDFKDHLSASGKKLTKSEETQKRLVKDSVVTYVSSIPDMLYEGYFLRNKDKPYNSMILIGGPNSGKSLLASCIAVEGVKRGCRMKIFEWSQILSACFDFEGDDYKILCNDINRKDQIVIIENIDEMYERGSNQSGIPSSVLRRINSMFMLRWKSGIPMIMTSSQDVKSLVSGKYGSALTSIIEDALELNLPAQEGLER